MKYLPYFDLFKYSIPINSGWPQTCDSIAIASSMLEIKGICNYV